MNRYLAILLFLFAVNSSLRHALGQNSVDDSTIIRQLRLNNVSFVNDYIKTVGVDNVFMEQTYTLLSFAVVENNLNLVKLSLQNGADINLIVNNLSPLMHCAINDRAAIAALLIKYGATVDLYNKHRNTALLYASRYGNLSTVKVLSQSRANPFFKNFMGYNSLDYAQENHKSEVVDYLRGYMAAYAKGAFPSTYDGPHLQFIGLNKLKAFYLVNDSLMGRVYTKSKSYRIRDSVVIDGIIPTDTLRYVYYKKPIVYMPDNEYAGVSKIFAIGDIHGSYDSLVNLLRSNQIIDNELNWVYGKGHVVFIGDIFDRGEKVTETLWLVYKLWSQAPRFNGRVHILLGNHELLILSNDYRYLNEKYSYLTRGVKMEYSSLFSNHTLFGRFVRSFKVVIKINDVLFAHAGLTHYLVDKNISISELNSSLNLTLNRNENSFISESDFLVFQNATSDQGPFWYRGYLSESKSIPRATQQDLDKVLGHYNAKLMVIGHTEVLKIEGTYGNKLIPINVPFDRVGIPNQALLFINNHIFRCNSRGAREIIQ